MADRMRGEGGWPTDRFTQKFVTLNRGLGTYSAYQGYITKGMERFLEVFCTSRAWCVGGEPVVWTMGWRATRGSCRSARGYVRRPSRLGPGSIFVSKTYLIWYAGGGGGVRRRRIFTKNKSSRAAAAAGRPSKRTHQQVRPTVCFLC